MSNGGYISRTIAHPNLQVPCFGIRHQTSQPVDATPNGLAMNLPILHDISCISYKDYKRSK